MARKSCFGSNFPAEIGSSRTWKRKGVVVNGTVVGPATPEDFLEDHPEWRDTPAFYIGDHQYYWLGELSSENTEEELHNNFVIRES